MRLSFFWKIFSSSFFLIAVIIFIPFHSLQAKKIDFSYLLEEAEKRSHRVISSLYKVKAKKYERWQEISQYLPQVSFSSLYAWEEYKTYYHILKKGKAWQYYLSLRQPVFDPELIAKIKQSSLYLEMEKLKLAQQKAYVKYYTLSTLCHLSYFSTRIQLLKQLINVDKDKLLKGKLLRERNFISLDTYFELQKDYEDVSYKLRTARLSYRQFKFILDTTIGNSTLKEAPYFSLKFNPELLFFRAKKLASRIEDNFEVRIARLSIKIADYEFKTRRFSDYPKVSIVSVYNRASTPGISSVARDFRIGITINFPIFNSGYYYSTKKEALELKFSAEEDYRATLQEKQIELERRLSDLKQQVEAFKVAASRLGKDFMLMQLTEDAVKEHTKSVFDLLNISSRVIQDKLDLLDALHQALTDYIELLYLTNSFEDFDLVPLKLALELEDKPLQ